MSLNPPKLAIILDLDGVITQTARLHAQAWKQIFDEYLHQWSNPHQAEPLTDNSPFSIETDYVRYVDGRPRYEGVQTFLASRGLALPYGNPNDVPGEETICGLGNRKNAVFLALIHQQGVDVYKDAVEQIQRWRSQGVKIAVVSASRNCEAILAAAGIRQLFYVKVDGVDAERLQLQGKPAPDTFLQAAKELEVSPQNAVILEDAISGVQAGRAGQFGLVVGVARNSSGADLKAQGADRVVQNLRELSDLIVKPLPSALAHFPALQQRLEHHRLALFLDYDGTLTPIVRRPEAAHLSEEMRSHLTDLARQMLVAIVSGRDLADVQQMVQIDTLYYAGSHGFDMAGPDHLRQQQPLAQQALPELDIAEDQLRNRLGVPGAWVERKRFAIAVHYREVAEQDIPQVETRVNKVLSQHPSLRKSSGKKIFELQPDIPWDKGQAILWLLKKLNLSPPETVPIYLGDDTTDEDAFRALKPDGLSIRVGDPNQLTAADYSLRDPDQVAQFFERLLQHLPRQKLNHDKN
ncbi:MAG: trehalose-phosphatase [Cyanobacteria bacterium P01_F01_bin.4]